MIKKILLIVLCVAAAFLVWRFSTISITEPTVNNTATVESPATAPAKTVTIGWTGDLVPATDQGYDLTVLNNVADTLAAQNLMIGNLDGTLASSGTFNGNASFADALKASGFDFINLYTQHSLDAGTTGLKATETELTRVDLPYIAPNKPTATITINGVNIGIMGVSNASGNIADYTYIAQTVEALKKNNDIVIFIFNGAAPADNVQAAAYTAINAGADLILGDGSRTLQKTEYYHKSLIAYSLGNFVGGNGRIATSGKSALGGILTATFQTDPNTNKEVLQPTYGFTSVTLAADGTPSLDPANQAKQLLDSLSKTTQ